MSDSIDKPQKANGGRKTWLLAAVAIVAMITLVAVYRFTSITGIVVFIILLVYLFHSPSRSRINAFIKRDTKDVPYRPIIGIMLFSLLSSTISMVVWRGEIEKSQQIEQRKLAGVTKKKELLAQVDSWISRNNFDKARLLLGQISNSTIATAEKREKQKEINEKANQYYQRVATELSRKSQWSEATTVIYQYLVNLGSRDRIPEGFKPTIYKTAVGQLGKGKAELAIAMLSRVKDYKDSTNLIEKTTLAINEQKYKKAVSLFQEQRYAEALPLFENLENFEDAAEYFEKTNKVVQKQKRIAAIGRKTLVVEKNIDEINKAIDRNDANSARTAFESGNNSLDEIERLGGNRSKVRRLKSLLTRREKKISKMEAEEEAQRKIAELNGSKAVSSSPQSENHVPTQPKSVSESVQIVRFLQGARSALKAASKQCFLATQCGYVDPSADTGEVATTAEIGPCLEERLASCTTAATDLRSIRAPASIATSWDVWVRHRVDRLRNEAELLVKILSTTKIPPRLHAKGESWNGLIGWAAAKGLESVGSSSDFVDRLMDSARAATEAQENILRLLPGVCREGVSCNIDKIMTGARIYLNSPYDAIR